jgi:hypothetical protein
MFYYGISSPLERRHKKCILFSFCNILLGFYGILWDFHTYYNLQLIVGFKYHPTPLINMKCQDH